ncbi:MAG: hypothetical protein ABFR75_14120 [Acidobacteriota bacterium]
MKRMFMLSLIFITALTYLLPVQKTVLPYLTKPDTLVVGEDFIYISNFPEVYLLSPATHEVKKKFGKQGEGPEEFKLFIRFHLDKDQIIINSSGKMSYYTKQGEFISEKKLPGNNVFKPVGKNYAGYRIFDNNKTKESLVAIDLFNKKFKKKKVLHTTPFKFQFGRQKIHPVRNQGNFRIFDNKIIVNGNNGKIHIFSSEGKKIRTIRPDLEKIKVSKSDKLRYREYYKSYPEYKQYYEAASKWFTFPQYFPPIHETYISDNRIYAETYEKKEEKRRFIILDFEGKRLGSVWLKVTDINPLEKHIYTFYKDKFYQLVENEAEEQWELHIEKLEY